jgi:hypothetical protein
MIKTFAGLTVFLMLASAAQASFAPMTSPIPNLRNNSAIKMVRSPQRLERSLIPRLRGSARNVVDNRDNHEIDTLVQIAEHERQKKMFRQKSKNSGTEPKPTIGLTHITRSLIPRLRPNYLTQPVKAKPKKKRMLSTRTRKGSVCGVSSIKGVNGPRINGRGSCGIARPVKVTQVAGVDLTRELIVNCSTAKKLDKWVARSVKPTIGRQGGGVAKIQIIGGYACRTRNSKRGAKISEHARGNAVDIAGFVLNDGTIYSVKRNWRRGNGRRTLRRLHKSACGPFGTVLGPNADRHHQDHFHLDTARHRSGAYCR